MQHQGLIMFVAAHWQHDVSCCNPTTSQRHPPAALIIIIIIIITRGSSGFIAQVVASLPPGTDEGTTRPIQ